MAGAVAVAGAARADLEPRDSTGLGVATPKRVVDVKAISGLAGGDQGSLELSLSVEEGGSGKLPAADVVREAASLGEGSGTAGGSQDEGSDGSDLDHFERLKS